MVDLFKEAFEEMTVPGNLSAEEKKKNDVYRGKKRKSHVGERHQPRRTRGAEIKIRQKEVDNSI